MGEQKTPNQNPTGQNQPGKQNPQQDRESASRPGQPQNPQQDRELRVPPAGQAGPGRARAEGSGFQSGPRRRGGPPSVEAGSAAEPRPLRAISYSGPEATPGLHFNKRGFPMNEFHDAGAPRGSHADAAPAPAPGTALSADPEQLLLSP